MNNIILIYCIIYLVLFVQDHGTSSSGVLVTSVPPTSCSMEDASAHWGVVMGRMPPESGGRCPVCTLPLTKPVSDLHPGVFVFQCGMLHQKFSTSESL